MKTAGLLACRESDAAASLAKKVEPNSTLRPMLDNVAKQTIIGEVDDRLRLVRHSVFMSSAAKAGQS
ncbi:hypothetical protein ACRQ84_10090 [Enterobacter ludwigii]